jgi:hypothetical protein
VDKHGKSKWQRHPKTRGRVCKSCYRKLCQKVPKKPVTVTLYNDTPRRSPLHQAMLDRFHYLAKREGMPVSYWDFKKFTIHGIKHKMAHGTFRNHISQAMKDGDIELAFHSGGGFYTLKGVKVGKDKLRDQAGGKSSGTFQDLVKKQKRANFLYNMIKNLPMNKTSVHNLNLSFKIPHIWSLFFSSLSLSSSTPSSTSIPTPTSTSIDTSSSTSSNSISILSSPILSSFNTTSKDIHLNTIDYEHLKLGIVIHHTDTVTVTVKCSFDPIPLNFTGITTLSNALTTVKDRLSKWVGDAVSSLTIPNSSSSKSDIIPSPSLPTPIVPDYGNWIVTMWHLNVDSQVIYNGEKFNIEWGDLREILYRVYSKEMKNGETRIRVEKQESPFKEYGELIDQLLHPSREVVREPVRKEKVGKRSKLPKIDFNMEEFLVYKGKNVGK